MNNVTVGNERSIRKELKFVKSAIHDDSSWTHADGQSWRVETGLLPSNSQGRCPCCNISCLTSSVSRICSVPLAILFNTQSRCGSQGQYDRKGRPFAALALNFELPAMEFDNPGADGQSKPRPLLGMGPCVIGAKESVEDSSLILFRDSNPVIRHSHPCVSLFDCQRDFDCAAGTGVFDRIIEKIQEQFAQAEFIAQYHGRYGRSKHNFDILFLSQQRGLPVEVLDKHVQWNRQVLHLHLAHVGPGEKEQ